MFSLSVVSHLSFDGVFLRSFISIIRDDLSRFGIFWALRDTSRQSSLAGNCESMAATCASVTAECLTSSSEWCEGHGKGYLLHRVASQRHE